MANKFVRITIVLLLAAVLLAPLILDHDTFAAVVLILVFGLGTVGLLMAVASQCVVEIARLSSMIQEFVYSLQVPTRLAPRECPRRLCLSFSPCSVRSVVELTPLQRQRVLERGG